MAEEKTELLSRYKNILDNRTFKPNPFYKNAESYFSEIRATMLEIKKQNDV